MSVYLRETPSHEPFNIDPDLVNILQKNQNIINKNPPLFVISPNLSNQNGTNVQTSISIIHIITFTQLYKFRRFKESESLYSLEFSKKVKEKYGNSITYLKSRLGFNQLPFNHPKNLRFDCNGNPIHYFTSDDGLIDGLDYKVIKNEWPYAIDHNYQHLIVWSRLKLLNPNLSISSNEYNLATEQGLSGFINLSKPFKQILKSFNLFSKINENQIGIGKEMSNFVKKRWNGYQDLIWFLNPIQLQSCPDLPHFHVFVKTQDFND
ncbi:hypothetical protein CROQUDRAFT_43892 [Cronartium quercuum f. sp. fusiforme G11]|uniref:Uncharacterized protein n=1 Tax=Cronartium quercuum f. sp. fusiforme G11 TaxID=708437 RepID=A0A9P6NMC7_9BASI|nr:hypothetical protein CROQUDRAFT_43892 [Cronartium quercuum f. sp. fusiforme G11]